MAVRGTLPKTMKALLAYSPSEYRLELTYPTPECGANDIIIKTEACGVCAGDLKCMHGVAKFWGDELQPGWVKPPFIPGHEFFGRVVQLGENVTGYEIGDRITADQIAPCGECRFCKTGRYWMCQPHNIYGFQYYNNGGMAEYVRYGANSVISKVPEELDVKQALLIEPYGCSKHAVDRANIGNEDVVVISGSGTLGLGMVTYARMKNPKLLIVLDMKDSRLEKAKEFVDTQLADKEASFICFGKKGADWAGKTDIPVADSYVGVVGGNVEFTVASTAGRTLIQSFLDGEIDQAFVIYSRFDSMAQQTPVVKQLLPIPPLEEVKTREEEQNAQEFLPEHICEPSAEKLLGEMLPRNVFIQLYDALLQTSTSEHASRMRAMENATKACEDLVTELQTIFNKTRQASITAELMDIVGGVEALRG